MFKNHNPAKSSYCKEKKNRKTLKKTIAGYLRLSKIPPASSQITILTET
tara:strand:+ start:259 stop:405 length:147 start_codon:yes stop_codon:yes gene_type:complete